RFNEAAAIQLRKRREDAPPRNSLARFNEAAAIQLRKLPSRDRGHAARWASMRPQQFSCGNRTSSRSPLRYALRFNEAAAIQLRKQTARKPPSVKAAGVDARALAANRQEKGSTSVI